MKKDEIKLRKRVIVIMEFEVRAKLMVVIEVSTHFKKNSSFNSFRGKEGHVFWLLII